MAVLNQFPFLSHHTSSIIYIYLSSHYTIHAKSPWNPYWVPSHGFFSRRLAWSSAYCRWKAASIPWASASRTAPWCRGNATWPKWLDFAGIFGDFVGDSREKTWNTCALGLMKFRVTEQRWHGDSSWILVSHENFLRNRVISLEMNPLVDDLLQNLDLENYQNGWLSGRFRSSQSSPKSTSTGWENPWFRRFFGSHFQRFEHINIFQPEKHLGPSWVSRVSPFSELQEYQERAREAKEEEQHAKDQVPRFDGHQCIFIGISMGVSIFHGGSPTAGWFISWKIHLWMNRGTLRKPRKAP